MKVVEKREMKKARRNSRKSSVRRATAEKTAARRVYRRAADLEVRTCADFEGDTAGVVSFRMHGRDLL